MLIYLGSEFLEPTVGVFSKEKENNRNKTNALYTEDNPNVQLMFQHIFVVFQRADIPSSPLILSVHIRNQKTKE